MPYYPYKCAACGLTEDRYSSIEHRHEQQCSCGGELEMQVYGPNIARQDKPIVVKQLGKTFQNAKHLDAWAEANGKAVLSPTDSKWRRMKDNAAEEADVDAQEQGFRDSEDHRNTMADEDKTKELVYEAQKTKINAYHDEHGSTGRLSVEDSLAEGE